MRRILIAGVTTTMVATAALAGSTVAVASPPSTAPAAARPAVVTISVSGGQTTVTPSQIRPGIVEFHVAKNFVVPGKQGGPDAMNVLRTDDLPTVLASLGAAFAADPGDPASMAAAAAAMKTLHATITAYGGGVKGTVWQVRLPAGNYTVAGLQTTAMGRSQPAILAVTGAPRLGALPPAQGVIRAVGPVGDNKWRSAGLQNLSDGWLRFTNAAHELHFLSMSGVAPDTTAAVVAKSFTSPKQPKYITGPFYGIDVVSPGVSVNIKGPFKAGKYLVDCFIPSETDGMPHALMGMWKLVQVG